MSYLLDLIKTFTEEENLAFKRIDLAGKEETVRDLYLQHARSPKFDEAAMAKKLAMSAQHWLKINSVLLDKTISAVFGDEPGIVLSAILGKGLSGLVLHEMKIKEKKVMRSNDQSAITAFFRASFDIHCRMYHPNYNSALTHQAGKKYLKALGAACTVADESYVNMMALYGDITSAGSNGREISFKPKAKKILDSWAEKISGLNNPVADFYTAFARATYYKRMTEDVPLFLAAYETALTAFRKSKGALDKKFEGIALCELGLGNIFLENFTMAEARYNEAFEKFANTLSKSIYHTAHYFAAALLNKNIKLACRIFDQYLKPWIQPSTNRSVLFDVYIQGAWLSIHLQQFEQAFSYVQLLQQYRKNEITLLGHAMVRQLESTCFYLGGQTDTALLTVGRNIRFVKKIQDKFGAFEYYLSYLEAIDKLIKMERGALRNPARLKDQILTLPGGIYQSYNRLLLNKYESLSRSGS